MASGKQKNLCRLWELVHSEDRLTGANALWVMTHLTGSDNEWLTGLRDEMIYMLLNETDIGKKRMLLQLLREQEYQIEDIRTDFLDFCISKINSE